MKEVDWAYLAGIIDGEGCITSYRNTSGSSYYVRIRISQVDPVFLYWIQEQVGGNIWTRPRHGHENFYTWGAESKEARKILIGIYPFLKLKKAQAAVAYRLTKRPPKGVQLSLHQELSQLKRVLVGG